MKTNQIIQGDAIEELKKLPDDSVDAIITDPPFNVSQKRKFTRKGVKDINMDFGEWDYFGNDEEGDKKYLEFIFSYLREFDRILKNSGSCYMFIAERYLSYARHFMKYKLGWYYKGTITWHKTNPAPRFLKNSFVSSCEWVMVACKNKNEATFNFLTLKEMHNFFESGSVQGKERLNHPTQKPEKLIERFVQISSNEGDVILDCFAGSGTTGVACLKLGRKFILIERERVNIFRLLKIDLNLTWSKQSYRKWK